MNTHLPFHGEHDPAGVAKVTRTFVLTDIEQSTMAWERFGDAFRPALDQHHACVRAEIARHGGQELTEAGDGFLIAFTDPLPALRCAKALQHRLGEERWPEKVGKVRVRISLHAGEVELRENGEYRGPVLNRNSRILAAAHGGQVVCSSAVAAALQAEAEFQELGIFRLRSVPAPERIFQICWPEMPCREFPPLNAPPAFVHNLPPSSTRFFGREKEIAFLREMIVAHSPYSPTGGVRGGLLVTLTGPGGTGKTRLSLAIAESLLAHLSHAVWFIALADVLDARLLAVAVRDALRIKQESTLDAFEQVVAFLAAEPALIVFDNFEQLGQEGAGFIRNLTARLPRLRCIITSRERLRLPGEREFTVPPLAAPEAGAPPERLLDYESVQLYLDRAQAVRSDFTITKRNAAAVAELCGKLEGIPLAIELAAAQANVATPQETVKALSERLDFFSNDAAWVPARHRTLRAAIDWSYDFLPTALQDFFANLSVFRGGCSAEAAEVIAAPPGLAGVSTNVLRALGELRGTSLLFADEVDGAMRFRMLETLRQYAEERLAARADAGEVGVRHRAYFLALAERAEPELQKDEQEEWLARLESEHDNFRAVFTRFPTHPDSLAVAAALVRFWMVRGYHSEGRLWLDRLRTEVTGAPERAAASAGNAAGILAWSNGDFAAARVAFEQALHYFRQIGVVENIAGLLTNVAIVAQSSGDLDAARQFGAESVEIYRSLPSSEKEAHLGQMAHALANLGSMHRRHGDLEAAHQILGEAVSLERRVGDQFGLAVALQNLGLVFSDQHLIPAARAAVDESLEIHCRIGARSYAAIALRAQAIVATREGRYAEAARWISASRIAIEKFGTRFSEEQKLSEQKDCELIRASLSAEAFEEAQRDGALYFLKTFGNEPNAHESL